MKYIIPLFVLVSSCSIKPSNEMEQMTESILKHKQGIEIDVKPIPKT